MYNAIHAIYENVTCCVKVNGILSDWFDVKLGLRQGCILSPILFNCFINDIAVKIKALGLGIDIENDEKLSILLYADDIVLLASNEQDLQQMLNCISDWCNTNNMLINEKKSNIVHFRSISTIKTNFGFSCGNKTLNIVNKYVYLGLVINAHLDYNVTAKFVSRAASRALGVLVAKYKLLGGMPHHVYKKLYDSMVWPVIAYGAAIWGTTKFSCIEAVENRAMRFFLGTGKYTPSAAVAGDMGWDPVFVKQMKCIANFWCRLSVMNRNRLNFKVSNSYCKLANRNCRNWYFRVTNLFSKLGCIDFCSLNAPLNKNVLARRLSGSAMEVFIDEWVLSVHGILSKNGQGRNKLRLYQKFKLDYEPEHYVNTVMPYGHRSALAKFRCGVAPIRVETGRYERLDLNERICPVCTHGIEDEMHVLLYCYLYNDVRQKLYEKAVSVCNSFRTYSDIEK